MKRNLSFFLQMLMVLIGIVAISFLLWEPLVEGRNEYATLYEIYFQDPFLAYAYGTSILFFVILYQIFRILGYIREKGTLSANNTKAFRIIKFCGAVLAILIALPVTCLFIARPGDDIAGGVAIGLFIIVVSIAIASTAYLFEMMTIRNN